MELAVLLAQLIIEIFKDVLVVALTILTIWLILSLVTTWSQEWIISILNWPSQMLEDSIRTLLGNEELSNAFYEHPLLRNLYQRRRKQKDQKPIEILGREFAVVLLDVFMNAGRDAGSNVKVNFKNLQTRINLLRRSDDSGLKNIAKTLDTLLIGIEYEAKEPNHAIAECINRVEIWFNTSMERQNRVYGRRAQGVSIVVGVLIAAMLNIDSISIVEAQWRAPIIKAVIEAQANQFQLPDSSQLPDDPSQVMQQFEYVPVFSLPILWSSNSIPHAPNDWVKKIYGILISGLAAAQGTTFWIDVIKKPFWRKESVPAAAKS